MPHPDIFKHTVFILKPINGWFRVAQEDPIVWAESPKIIFDEFIKEIWVSWKYFCFWSIAFKFYMKFSWKNVGIIFLVVHTVQTVDGCSTDSSENFEKEFNVSYNLQSWNFAMF